MLCAHAQIRRADFVTLIGDTDDAIRFAKVIKDLFATDPAARRAVLQARDAVIQNWLEEKPAAEFTEQERAAVRNPDYYDRSVVSAVNVAFAVLPVSITLEWDVPPRLWPRLAAAIIPVANRVARDGVFFGRKALRLVVKLQGAEMYRANADTDGNIAVVFQYE
jgi:hypothetical protein